MTEQNSSGFGVWELDQEPAVIDETVISPANEEPEVAGLEDSVPAAGIDGVDVDAEAAAHQGESPEKAGGNRLLVAATATALLLTASLAAGWSRQSREQQAANKAKDAADRARRSGADRREVQRLQKEAARLQDIARVAKERAEHQLRMEAHRRWKDKPQREKSGYERYEGFDPYGL